MSSLDWDDGTIVVPSFPTGHIYTTTGTFTITLVVQNSVTGSTLTGECTDTVTVSTECGNSITEIGETCDAGTGNGVSCSADYDDTCSYCSSTCQSVTVTGSYCGDSTIDS